MTGVPLCAWPWQSVSGLCPCGRRKQWWAGTSAPAEAQWQRRHRDRKLELWHVADMLPVYSVSGYSECSPTASCKNIYLTSGFRKHPVTLLLYWLLWFMSSFLPQEVSELFAALQDCLHTWKTTFFDSWLPFSKFVSLSLPSSVLMSNKDTTVCLFVCLFVGWLVNMIMQSLTHPQNAVERLSMGQ